jgi:sensor histidine kinase YesM
VLYNYLSNAIKFSNEGGEITVHATPEGEDYFLLDVRDTGIGIKADDLARRTGSGELHAPQLGSHRVRSGAPVVLVVDDDSRDRAQPAARRR